MQIESDDMKEEYDFSNMQEARGNYYQAYRQGHTVLIHKENGDTETHYFTLAEGAVMLDPDVAALFPDSNAVNEALRFLIRDTQQNNGIMPELAVNQTTPQSPAHTPTT